MKVKEESKKAGLKLNIQKIKNVVSGSITSWQIDGVEIEIVTDFLFFFQKIFFYVFLSKDTVDGDCSHRIKDACSLKGNLWET